MQLKAGVCVRRNGRGVGCTGKTVERQAPLCVCVRERERERERLGWRLGLAHTAFGISGGVCNGSRSSYGMGFITKCLLVLKVRLN